MGALLDHPEVDGISFVGSAATARIVYTRAAATGKRVQALGGAKNALTLMPDADPRLMVDGVMGSAFGAAGQRCLAGSIAVLVGTEAEQDRTRDLLVEGARAAARRRRRRPCDRRLPARHADGARAGRRARSSGPRPRAPRSSSTGAATPGPAGHCSGRRSSTGRRPAAAC